MGSDGKFRFDESRVDAARSSCMTSFRQALSDGVQLVCVDNISATQASYCHLVQLASVQNYHVKVVEMPCPDIVSLQHFFARSRKTTPGEGYSYDYILSLWSLWEPHSEQILSPVNFHNFSVSDISQPTQNAHSNSQPASQHGKVYYSEDIPRAALSQNIPSNFASTSQSLSSASQSISAPYSHTNSQYFSHSHISNHDRQYNNDSTPFRHHAKKEELLQQLYHLKQQEVVLQQQLKQQKLCDQLSSRSFPRRFSRNGREGTTTTVILAPYTAPQVNTSRNKFDKQSGFSSFSFLLGK